jgi:hypothetical protein
MAKPTVEEAQKELKFREKQSQSGWLTALVASLSNDDEARADYLRKKGFHKIQMLFILLTKKTTWLMSTQHKRN